MMIRFRPAIVTLLVFLASAGLIPRAGNGQPVTNEPATVGGEETLPDASSEVRAVFVDDAPRIDGRLDEPFWSSIPPITQFYQVWPEDGAPGTERSEARIAYDRDHLFVGFTFYDRNPELIRAKNLERGGRNDRDDHAYIGLDTFGDKRNAYLFEMNALGTQDDATISDEGLTLDSFSWDAVYRSEAVITDEGWTMEVSIPFRQLRFPEGEEVEFGLMLSRMINRKNERVIWPHIGLEYGTSFTALAAVSQYGRLTGLTNIRRGKNIEIKPYVIAGVQEIRPDLSLEATDVDFTRDLGVDVKYGVTSNLTLDLTVNTDFAQVEDDNVQINLTRFNLFFPEKREFFLERAGLFDHGNPRSTQTFFSRRIGLTNHILGGGRLTGQVGRFSVGLLNIETGQEIKDFLGANSANNTVARVRTDFLKRGTAGAIFTNFEEANHYNRVAGVDAQYRFWGASETTAWYTRMWDSDGSLNDDAGHASLALQNDLVGAKVGFTSVGQTYNPALGFVRRRDLRELDLGARFTPVVSISALPFVRRLWFEVERTYIEGQDREKQTVESTLATRIDLTARDFMVFAYGQTFERLDEPFFIQEGAPIPVGDYTFGQFTIEGVTDTSRRLFASVEASTGDFFNGRRTDLGGSIGFRQSQHLSLEAFLEHALIDLPIANGSFDATTVSLSVLGALNRTLFARALIQYDNFSRDLQANIRINWIHTPGSDLFLVFNTSSHFPRQGEDLFDPRRNLILNDRVGVFKLTYLVLL
jgi:hypothetical protein